ncbi:hypothetical protein AX16_009429 [Volvariella volvacea WC 439]|nr:hypothetical protein AX16_009429 [Volvariella volvacea WC 439]
MLLAGLFVVAFSHSLTSPISAHVPDSSTPDSLCAAIVTCDCDPTGTRTVFDITYSCIGVIVLSTYLAIHHNIPDQNDSQAQVEWVKIKTTLFALITPEIVIIWAIRERIMAKDIFRKNQHRKWTRTHEFFVQMGGLMQYVDNGVGGTYRKEIKDRGKEDILAKVVVIVPTTWFATQCIARHVQGADSCDGPGDALD